MKKRFPNQRAFFLGNYFVFRWDFLHQTGKLKTQNQHKTSNPPVIANLKVYFKMHCF